MEFSESLFKIYKEFDESISKKVQGKIYHYTSPEGFESILRNKNLHFTDRRFLNDKNESGYIRKFFYENANYFTTKMNCTIEDYEWAFEQSFYAYNHGTVGFFLCSFSLDKDNLSLWNYYTKGDKIAGYNIGFNIAELIKEKYDDYYMHGKVIYSDKKKLEIVDRTIDILLSSVDDKKNILKGDLFLIIHKLVFISAFFKEKCFKVENEYRFIIIKGITEQEDNRILFKVRNGIFIPYIEYSFTNKAIADIFVSPTIDKLMAESSLETLMNVYNIPGKNIYFSNVPVRY